MKKDSTETISLAGEAYVILRERILRGELAIGKVISRRKIATELGMSLLPVSEAYSGWNSKGCSKAARARGPE